MVCGAECGVLEMWCAIGAVVVSVIEGTVWLEGEVGG